MVTGDNIFTAMKVAKDLDFYTSDNVLFCDILNSKFEIKSFKDENSSLSQSQSKNANKTPAKLISNYQQFDEVLEDPTI